MPNPNILLILVDQLRFDCLASNGHPFIKTPNLDRLAQEGVNFTQAYTPNPLCVPSRNSLLYGQWSTSHLAIANTDTEAPRPAREGLTPFSRLLRETGYTLSWVGKWGVSPSSTPFDAGFHTYIGDSNYPKWRAKQGLPPKPNLNTWFGELDPCIEPEQSRLGWGASRVIDLLQEQAGSQPFFIRWDTNEPHLPNILPEPFFSLYPPASIPHWRSFPDPLINKPYIQGQQRRTWKLDRWTWQDWAPIVSRYLGEISLIDAQVGRILDTLDQLNLARNTMVVFCTDHGDMCGGHGMIDKHYVLYDDVVHVPLIIRFPGQARAGSTCHSFVSSSLDLAATFCDAANLSIPDTYQGQSLLPLLNGNSGNDRTDIFSMYHGNQFGLYSQRMVRDERWKYIWNATAEDELYDVLSDPGELKNLAVDPDHRSELQRLRTRLVAWMESTRDPLINPWIRTQLLEDLKI